MLSRFGRAAASLLPFLLAGCALSPADSQTAGQPPTPRASATVGKVASSAAPATVSGGAGNDATPIFTGTASQPTATTQASATGTTAPSATGTAAPSATRTPIPSVTATPTPSATPSPTVAPTPVILAPVHLAEAEVGGSALYPRYWTNTKAIVFSMAAAPGTTSGMRPQVEVEPLGRPYTGRSTATGAVMPPNHAGSVVVAVGTLPEGAYHWQARLADDKGHAGPWADYYQGPAFRLDRTPPGPPVITSITHPNQHATYSAAMVQVSWTKPADRGGIQGYLTGVDRKPDGVPTGPLSGVTHTVLGPLANGDIYFHVRAEDWAGNLGQIATYALHIDHRPPVLAHAFFDRFQFNPQFDTLSMHFVPDKTVQVQVEIRRQSTKGIVRTFSIGQVKAGARATVSWDGRNQGGLQVRPDLYTMEIYATDRLGNVGDAIYTDLSVNYRRIVIHLGAQSLDVYDGDKLLRSTLVTTGNKQLPTPLGVWHITSRYHPYKFISPWKKGSPYWYPTSDVNYALYFHSGGYFIHDAPWRSVFGPGTNSSPGLPGSGIYAGSHGCVETTIEFAHWLYTWAPNGTVVDVVQ